MTVVSQVWQTPVRQDQRTAPGTPEVPEPPGAMGGRLGAVRYHRRPAQVRSPHGTSPIAREVGAVKLLSDFKQFVLRGNVVDLAVAVVIGTAFAAVVKALVTDLLTPIIALIFGKPSFENLSFTINSSHFLYGDFINALITFVSIAAAVFFFVVAPINALMKRRAQEDPDTKECPECTSAIPVKARRCPQCTAELAGAAA
jgi:large conductance mechanosensitive channel